MSAAMRSSRHLPTEEESVALAQEPQPPTRVLLVEGSPTQADWIAEVLRREGYLVQVAKDGSEAVNCFHAGPPDLVLLDFVLPDVDGFEVLRVLKSRSGERFTPILLLSAESDLDMRVTGLRMGADDFLAAPFADAEIRARAASLLRIKGLQDELWGTKAELERIAVTDGLTGLRNRRHLDERLREEFGRAQRYSDALSFLMLDLDHFKQLNDQYGHPFGNRVLRETAHLLGANLREADLRARYGGEKFAVILPKTHLRGALAVAERCLKAIREKTHHVAGEDPGGSQVRITASAGVGWYPSKVANSLESLIKGADEALYLAKRAGRDRVCHL